MKNIRIASLLLLFLVLIGVFTSCGRLDKTELEEVLNREYDPSGYTEASYQNYLKRYREAMDVYQSNNTTAFRIESVTVNLLKAIEDLVPVADFTELLEELAEEINPMAYTSASYQVYKTVYDSAVIVASNEFSKQSVVNNALRNLRTAKKALVPKVDTSSLGALLEKEYDEDLYTRSSYASYKQSADAARALLFNDSATESDIRLAMNGLQQAIARLVLRGSTDELKSLADAVKIQYLDDKVGSILPSQRYTRASLDALQAAYNTAIDVCVGMDASQTKIDLTKDALQSAVGGLIDKISLYEAIMRMEKYLGLQDKYTPVSFDSYLYAVTSAMNVDAAYAPSIQEIQDAVLAIEAAENALVRRPLDPSGRTDFDLASLWIICYDCRVSLDSYFANYAGFYNQIFESLAMVEQSGNATFRLRDGYSVTILPGIISITDIGRTNNDEEVTVLGVSFNLDEYAVSELLGAPTNYIANGGTTKLLYEDDTAGIVCEFNFSHGKMDSIMISQTVYPLI